MKTTALLYDSLRSSWLRSLRARNTSAKTQRLYERAAQQFGAYMAAEYPKVPPAGLRREHVEGFLEVFAAGKPVGKLPGYEGGRAPSTVSLTYRSLQQWFTWLLDESEVEADPTARMQPPIVPPKDVPVLSEDQLRALLAVCPVKTTAGRRDIALLRLMIDTGGRLEEVARLKVSDVDLDGHVVQVLGKGRRPRPLPIGRKTVEALDRYLRIRNADRKAGEPGLWLGEKGKGPLTPSGVYQVVRRRGREAGLPNLHPHQFRHTGAHRWLVEGGNEGDLMQIMGWKSRSMLQRYGASAAAERARQAHRTLALGDRL